MKCKDEYVCEWQSNTDLWLYHRETKSTGLVS